MGTLTVVTNLWNDEGYRWNEYFRYSPAHVNRLYRAVCRHVPHTQFVCFTDLYRTPAASEFDAGIDVLPMWDWGAQYGGCWRRLKLFDPHIERHFDGDHVLALDLDVVIVDDLSPLLVDLPSFKGWRNVDQSGGYVCGSMFAWEKGKNNDIWEDFNEQALHKIRVVKAGRHDAKYRHPRAYQFGFTIGSEQTWLSYKRVGCPLWNRRDGVYSFRYHLLNACKQVRPLPSNARIVHFHGPVDPSQYPQVDWIRKHWLGELNET